MPPDPEGMKRLCLRNIHRWYRTQQALGNVRADGQLTQKHQEANRAGNNKAASRESTPESRASTVNPHSLARWRQFAREASTSPPRATATSLSGDSSSTTIASTP